MFYNGLRDHFLKTFSYRVKDRCSSAQLAAMARSVNLVWNYCNEISLKSAERGPQWVTLKELFALTKGAGSDLGLSSQTIQAIAGNLSPNVAKSAAQNCAGAASAPGWIPFKNQTFTLKGATATYAGRTFRLWLHREIEGRIISGNFSQDARGRWYCNITCEITREISRPKAPNCNNIVGIDLGFKTVARAINAPDLDQASFYRDLEPKLAEAQRQGRARQVKSIHAKITNRRKDALHKYARAIVNDAGAIFVGNISSTWQVKSGRGKATLDMSWSTLRNLLKYKCDHAGIAFLEVDEKFTTQACSVCQSIGGPKGRNGLGIRQWVCAECGTVHDRDLNAAINIARLGCETLGLKWPGSLGL